MPIFQHNPTTITIQSDEGEITWIGEAPTYGPLPGGDAPVTIALPIRGEVKFIGISDILEDGHSSFRGTSYPNGFDVEMHPTMPGDVVGSISVDSKIPLPPIVVSMMVSQRAAQGAYGVEPTLQALTNDNGRVATMLLTSDAGAFVRYDRVWIGLADADIVDGLDVFDVEPEALDLYDDFDQIGQNVHIADMPLLDGLPQDMNFKDEEPPVTKAPENTKPDTADAAEDTTPDSPDDFSGEEPVGEPVPMDDDMPMTAAAIATISTPEQLDRAIALATEHEEIQWFVEKRHAVLGSDAPLPWKDQT